MNSSEYKTVVITDTASGVGRIAQKANFRAKMIHFIQ
jgi:hypothetical protein